MTKLLAPSQKARTLDEILESNSDVSSESSEGSVQSGADSDGLCWDDGSLGITDAQGDMRSFSEDYEDLDSFEEDIDVSLLLSDLESVKLPENSANLARSAPDQDNKPRRSLPATPYQKTSVSSIEASHNQTIQTKTASAQPTPAQPTPEKKPRKLPEPPKSKGTQVAGETPTKQGSAKEEPTKERPANAANRPVSEPLQQDQNVNTIS